MMPPIAAIEACGERGPSPTAEGEAWIGLGELVEAIVISLAFGRSNAELNWRNLVAEWLPITASHMDLTH